MARKLKLARVWADIEDYLVPYLHLDPHERVLYHNLLRHSRVVGKRTVSVSKRGLAQSACLSTTCVLSRLRTLVRKGCVRVVDRGYHGHMVEVLTPNEIAGCVPSETKTPERDLEAANCFRNREQRQAIYRREEGRCFYCQRRLAPRIVTLDHVVPMAQGGDHSYRNVVMCCFECNELKWEHTAKDFLRLLLRKGRLTRRELAGRRAALKALQRGLSRPNLHKPVRLKAARAQLAASLNARCA
jgi:5-methylcytosine-specific restriction endonuclease McrA